MTSLRHHATDLFGLVALTLLAVPALGQAAPDSDVMDMREADASWVNDPNMKEFYRVTVDAFANGPAQVDRAAYEKRSREIFRAAAISRNMAPEPFLEHLAAIPGEMIAIVIREPETLASYESFVAALFGPQPMRADSASSSR